MCDIDYRCGIIICITTITINYFASFHDSQHKQVLIMELFVCRKPIRVVESDHHGILGTNIVH